ncbi:MAG TPA: 2-C-methyl-D-erythritol 2,4-cyclodiphosphate synthase [Nitrospiria bacterium]|nr:2-C-methyl-D-erythritol 2,4-cyclodiphosphate synthase [Nitrospiria bacterium]HUK57273.1 2-C-methyl-D-erythritol 2,4-cyclodiphosphate synthase [Nitrospiria bacterium]
MIFPQIRTGIGYDIHPLQEKRPLIIGGVEIPYSKGLAGHSDADVLCHAISDALLGAAAEGDLGRHFPDTDPQYKGISSLLLLEKVCDRLRAGGFAILHIDTIVIAQAPRLTPYLDEMRTRLAKTITVEEGAVNIKAKSAEGLDSIGRGESIAAQAVCTIVRV